MPRGETALGVDWLALRVPLTATAPLRDEGLASLWSFTAFPRGDRHSQIREILDEVFPTRVDPKSMWSLISKRSKPMRPRQ